MSSRPFSVEHEIRTFALDKQEGAPIAVDLHTIDTLFYQGSQESLQIAGAMCVDLAARDYISEERKTELLDRASGIWSFACHKWWERAPMLPSTLRSAIGLATLSAQRSIILEHTLPPLDTVWAIHDDLCTIGSVGVEMQRQFTETDEPEAAMDTVGILSELVVLLLHNRFALQQLVDGSMLALPAYLTQDNGVNALDSRGLNNHWDVSIFAEYPPEPPKVVYKVQAKSRYHPKHPKYSEDIAVVFVGDDLVTSYGETRHGIKPRAIVKECVQENSNLAGEYILQRLGSRTELLLDSFDENPHKNRDYHNTHTRKRDKK